MGIPGFQRETPVAQMYFASEFPLSQGSHSINGLKDDHPSKSQMNLIFRQEAHGEFALLA